MRMKNRSAGRFMRQLAATALCAALVTAAMGMAVPAQSPEEEEAAGYAVEAEESDSQGAQASDLIIEDGAEEDEDALYDDGRMASFFYGDWQLFGDIQKIRKSG